MPDTFIVGFLSAIVIILVIALVVGIVGIVVLFKRTRDLAMIDEDIYRSISQTSDDLYRKIDDEVNSVNRHIDGNWSEMEKITKSYTDKQINLLENRLKENNKQWKHALLVFIKEKKMKICKTTRNGFRCQFATRDGKCTFNGGTCSPVVSACDGCTNIETYGNLVYCKSYMNPESKWIGGAYCPMCSVKKNVDTKTQKINPLKASKRAAKARKASMDSSSSRKSKK